MFLVVLGPDRLALSLGAIALTTEVPSSIYKHPAKPREDVYSRKPGFTETRLRPLARLREITARPLLVFIRVRNPCVFER